MKTYQNDDGVVQSRMHGVFCLHIVAAFMFWHSVLEGWVGGGGGGLIFKLGKVNGFYVLLR